MKRFLISLIALMVAASMMIPAFAEDTAATADPAAESVADASTTLSDAQSAYSAAKESSALTEYEAELKTMVGNGSLTQEQADVLLTAAKEAEALQNGTCPNCGYQFQTVTTGKNGRGIIGKMNGKNGRAQAAAPVSSDDSSASDSTTALQQAQDAYNTAKQNSHISDYETELKTMVENGSLTQEQADLLLTAAKEAQALANGTCPSCGYQFQTTTGAVYGRNGMNNGKGRGGKR